MKYSITMIVTVLIVVPNILGSMLAPQSDNFWILSSVMIWILYCSSYLLMNFSMEDNTTAEWRTANPILEESMFTRKKTGSMITTNDSSIKTEAARVLFHLYLSCNKKFHLRSKT